MPKDWRGNVRYLLKQLFRWRLNCTEIAQASDRRAVFPHHSPKRTPTANLLKEPLFALPKIVLFYALPQVLPHLRAHQKATSLRCFHSRNRLSKKSRRKRFAPSGTSVSSWHYFVILSLLLLNLRGFSSKQQGLHLKRSTYIFSSPATWRHSISPNFFYKPNTARKPKTYTYKSPYRNDKNSVLPFTKAIILPGVRHSPTAVGRFPLTTDTDFQRNKNFARYREHGLHFFLTLQAKAVGCMLSLCEKTDYPRVLFLISSLLFAKSSPFSGKSRLVFPPSSRTSFFSSRSA